MSTLTSAGPKVAGMPSRAVVVAGTASGVGKTTVTLWILHQLKEQGIKVSSFKVGPDYIDPRFHQEITGEQAINLDLFMQGRSELRRSFEKYSSDSDVSVIEGVMGLYDGHRSILNTSTASLSNVLDVPVLLVVDCAKAGQSVAATVRGFVKYPKAPMFAGIFLNNLASEKHLELVTTELQRTCQVEVVGHMFRSRDTELPETHLGLDKRMRGTEIIKKVKSAPVNLALEKILALPKRRGRVRSLSPTELATEPHIPFRQLKIALAYDEAFYFYYRSDLDALKDAGFKIETFSPLRDKRLPKNTDLLMIGGGYPEKYAVELGRNKRMIEAVREHRNSNGFIYAECGGLMYLARDLMNGRSKTRLTGVLPIVINMGRRRTHLGYVDAVLMDDSIVGKKGARLRGHKFHWSFIGDVQGSIGPAYDIGDGLTDGFLDQLLLASYVHLNLSADPKVPQHMYKYIQRKAT